MRHRRSPPRSRHRFSPLPTNSLVDPPQTRGSPFPGARRLVVADCGLGALATHTALQPLPRMRRPTVQRATSSPRVATVVILCGRNRPNKFRRGRVRSFRRILRPVELAQSAVRVPVAAPCANNSSMRRSAEAYRSSRPHAPHVDRQ